MSMTFISAVTASGADEVEFTSGIDGTYDEYVFICTAINPETDDVDFQFQASIDGGSNYDIAMVTTAWSCLRAEGATTNQLGYETADDQVGTAFQNLSRNLGNGATECCAGILHLFNPASTTFVKHFYANFNGHLHHDYSNNDFVAGYFNDADDDINAVQFQMSSGAMDGVIRMYGVS